MEINMENLTPSPTTIDGGGAKDAADPEAGIDTVNTVRVKPRDWMTQCLRDCKDCLSAVVKWTTLLIVIIVLTSQQIEIKQDSDETVVLDTLEELAKPAAKESILEAFKTGLENFNITQRIDKLLTSDTIRRLMSLYAMYPRATLGGLFPELQEEEKNLGGGQDN
jgi:hypothetical protein